MDFFNDIFHNLALLEFYFLNIIYILLYIDFILSIFFQHSNILTRASHHWCLASNIVLVIPLMNRDGDVLKALLPWHEIVGCVALSGCRAQWQVLVWKERLELKWNVVYTCYFLIYWGPDMMAVIFADDIVICIILKEHFWISNEIALKSVLRV